VTENRLTRLDGLTDFSQSRCVGVKPCQRTIGFARLLGLIGVPSRSTPKYQVLGAGVPDHSQYRIAYWPTYS
jgi:hypothetical protein